MVCRGVQIRPRAFGELGSRGPRDKEFGGAACWVGFGLEFRLVGEVV